MRERKGSVVTIGVYDGIHLGHQRVLAYVRQLALTSGLESVVVTFDRHPASVVRPESAPLQLTDLPHRLELLSEAGIDDVYLIEFTPSRAAESAEDFVDEVLVDELRARVVVVGRDFHFGRGRGGNVALLEEMGSSRGFRVEPFELVADGKGEVVSSTRIRHLVETARLEEAALLLGRPHEVRGLVVAEASAFEGAGDGPAGASVEVPPEMLLPPPGGYSCTTGLVGAGGVPLHAARVVVAEKGSALSVLGLTERPREGSPMRVLFESPLGEKTEATSD